jgi:hypothetical protein
MRSLWLTAALAVALMLDGCRGKRQPEPVPGPQAALMQRATADAVVRDNITAPDCPSHPRGASEISWFQGTLEEAFSRRSSKGRSSNDSRPLFHY